MFPIVQSQNVPPKITYFPHRNPHQQSVPTRGKRQSEASSLFFPAALEGAVLPSQYPWAILWDPTVSDEEGAQSSASSTPRPYYHREWGLLERDEPARGLDLKGVPTTLRPHGFPPLQEGQYLVRSVRKWKTSYNLIHEFSLSLQGLTPNFTSPL